MNTINIRTGICTTDFERQGETPLTADRLFGKMAALGFASTQFAFSSIAESDFVPNGQIEIPERIPSAAIDGALRASDRHGMPIGAINGTFNMAHPDREIRREGIRRFALLAEAASELGADFITLCSGTRNPDHLWSPSGENHTDAAWADMEDTVLRAVEIAERRSITLAIESEASNIIDTPERARAIMDRVGSQRLKMILDCANLFHPGHARPEEVRPVIAHAFELFGQDIVIAHGKDIRAGEGIEFCGTGQGIVDFAYMIELLDKAGFSGDMFLHGIYDEADMPSALSLFDRFLARFLERKLGKEL